MRWNRGEKKETDRHYHAIKIFYRIELYNHLPVHWLAFVLHVPDVEGKDWDRSNRRGVYTLGLSHISIPGNRNRMELEYAFSINMLWYRKD